MSDEEDLLKLKKRYEKGEIPKSRYEEERAWILGTASLLMPGGDMEDEQGGDSDGTEAGHLKKTAEISSDDVSEAPVITVDDVCRMKPAAEEKKKEAKESDLDLKYAEDEAAILGKRASCAAVSSGASSSGSFERTEPDRSFIRGTEEKDSGLSASGNDAEKNTADSAENPAGTAGILPGKNSAEKSRSACSGCTPRCFSLAGCYILHCSEEAIPEMAEYPADCMEFCRHCCCSCLSCRVFCGRMEAVFFRQRADGYAEQHRLILRYGRSIGITGSRQLFRVPGKS